MAGDERRAEIEAVQIIDAAQWHGDVRGDEGCPKCGKASASPPAEVYCVDCATEGWEQDAAAHRAVRDARGDEEP